MSLDRRDFLVTMGGAAGALTLLQIDNPFWMPVFEEDVGWAPGIEERIASSCLVCPSRCGMTGRVVDGKLVRLSGHPLHPLSRGGLCPRGIAGVQTLYHPERLAGPLVRAGERGAGEWVSTTREEAIAQISETLGRLRTEDRPEALAVLAGYCAGTMHDVWQQFLDAFGSPNYVSDAYGDATEGVMAAMHGIAQRPSYDLDRADLVLSFGAPLFESWWSPLQAFAAFAQARREGFGRRHYIQVDHRFSRTAAHCDEWVGVHPGSHAVLALGIAYVIVRDRLYDEDFMAERVTGFEDFTDSRGQAQQGFRTLVLQSYRSEEVSQATGVSVERITELARAFAESERPVAVLGWDLTHAPHGLLDAMAVHSLNLLVGAVNRPGGVWFIDDAPLTPLAPVARDAANRAGRATAPVAGAPRAFADTDQPTRFAQAVAGSPEPLVDALLVYGSNPLATSSHPEEWRTALERIGLVVSFSPFMDETTRYADIVLPDLLPYETWQDAPSPSSYPYPAWGIARPMVEAHPGGTHAAEAVFAVAQALGGTVADSLPYDSFEGLLRSRSAGLFEAGRGRTFASEFELAIHRQREERGWWLPSQNDPDSFWTELVERGGWVDQFYDPTDPDRWARTPSGRIEMLPQAVAAALEAEAVERRPYLYQALTPQEGDPEFPLRLLPYRVSTLASDTIALQPWNAEQPVPHPDVLWWPWVTVAPVTASALGLHDHELVDVVSPRGRYQARLVVLHGTAPDTVTAPVGLRDVHGAPANPLALLEEVRDPLTGAPSWHTTSVRLERASEVVA